MSCFNVSLNTAFKTLFSSLSRVRVTNLGGYSQTGCWVGRVCTSQVHLLIRLRSLYISLSRACSMLCPTSHLSTYAAACCGLSRSSAAMVAWVNVGWTSVVRCQNLKVGIWSPRASIGFRMLVLCLLTVLSIYRLRDSFAFEWLPLQCVVQAFATLLLLPVWRRRTIGLPT